jgi:hypothetical protein
VASFVVPAAMPLLLGANTADPAATLAVISDRALATGAAEATGADRGRAGDATGTIRATVTAMATPTAIWDWDTGQSNRID